MSHKIECVTGDDSLHVFKLARDWQRNLAVKVAPTGGGAERKVAFPAGCDRVEIDGLTAGAEYTVKVSRSRPWERFRHGTEAVSFVPGTRDLRLLITGSGRSGTKTFAHFLDGLAFNDDTPVIARHEPLADWVLEALAAGNLELPALLQRGALHNVESAPYYSLYPDAIRAERVILVIRDGRRVIQSGLNRGWYANNSPWNRIKKDYGGDQFENSCRLWVDANTSTAERAVEVFRLEDVVSDPGVLTRFCDAAGVVSDGRGVPHSNRGGKPSTGAEEWPTHQREQFEEICGGLMDRYYPDWRSSW